MIDNVLKFFGLVKLSKHKKDVVNAKLASYKEGYAAAASNKGSFINLPKQAEPSVIEAVASECIRFYSQYGLKKLYLIGSRAKGTAHDKSDHDFFVVIGDNAPDEIVQDNGAYENLGIAKIRKAVSNVPKSPDVIICRESDFLARRNDPEEGFPYEADKYGCSICLNLS